MQTTQASLLSALKASAAGINGDDFKGLLEVTQVDADGTTDDPRYWTLMNWLHQVQIIFPEANPWTAHHLQWDRL